MNNVINLKFNGTISRLAGYDFGKEVYEQQVRPYIGDYEKCINIEFPSQIVKAASSFVQGFFEDFINRFGYDGIATRVNIISENNSLIRSIKDNLI